jgi:hypothetical protein
MNTTSTKTTSRCSRGTVSENTSYQRLPLMITMDQADTNARKFLAYGGKRWKFPSLVVIRGWIPPSFFSFFPFLFPFPFSPSFVYYPFIIHEEFAGLVKGVHCHTWIFPFISRKCRIWQHPCPCLRTSDVRLHLFKDPPDRRTILQVNLQIVRN